MVDQIEVGDGDAAVAPASMQLLHLDTTGILAFLSQSWITQRLDHNSTT
jgi:hypothetical protein